MPASSARADAARAWELLAPVVAGRPRARVSQDRKTFPRRCERDLTAQLPDAPAAVLLFDKLGAARCLAADFDISHGGRGQVDEDAARFAALIEACGGRSFADASPNGGRHVYVIWSAPVSVTDLGPVMRALRALFPSLDIAPMTNPAAGCIRPPGAAHRTGGHQVLTTPLAEALAAVAAPCGPDVWAALLDRLAPQLAALAAGGVDGPTAEKTTRAGPAARLSARIEAIARRGTYAPDRYATPSEARQAVITAAVAAGWTLPDVAARLEQGLWGGLAAMYARYRRPGTIRGALGRDWRKAVGHVERGKNAPPDATRVRPHSGGAPPAAEREPNPQSPDPGSAAAYGEIRSWWNAARVIERTRYTGPGGTSKRVLLRSLGAMAQRRGTVVVDVGRRSLALAGCVLDDATVSALLREMREEDDPLIELIEDGRGVHADRYLLRIPAVVAEVAAWRTWRPGRIGIHKAFRALGAPRALTYEALTSEPLPRRDLARDAALPSRTVDTALARLAEHGLAERVPGQGWRRGPAALDDVAELLGVEEEMAALIAEYAVERAAWHVVLGAIEALRSPDLTHSDASDPTWWPDQLDEPPETDPGDRAYDQALADVGADLDEADQLEEILELLHRELGAIPLGTYAPEDLTDPRYGVYAAARAGSISRENNTCTN